MAGQSRSYAAFVLWAHLKIRPHLNKPRDIEALKSAIESEISKKGNNVTVNFEKRIPGWKNL